MGAGMAQAANGTVSEGEWRDNRRYGPFNVLDAKGQRWVEKYNAEVIHHMIRRGSRGVNASHLFATGKEDSSQEGKAHCSQPCIWQYGGKPSLQARCC